MTKLEHSKVWAKHKAALEKAPAKEQKEHDKLSKKDKGLAASQWLLEKEGKKYMSALKKVKAEETLTRRDKWESELQMLQKFSQDELERHLASGRVIWREDPRTPYTYEYKDLADYEKVVKGKRGKEWTSGVEFDPEEEDLEKFLQLYNTEAVSGQLEAGGGTGLGKGQPSSLGKGQPSSLGKGRGKRNKRDLPALTNGEPEKEEEEDEEEETALEKAMKAARTARNMLTATKEDLELALEKASKTLSKSAQKAAQAHGTELGKALEKVKAILSGKAKGQTAEGIKDVLAKVATTIKAAKDEVKEPKHLANRAVSVAGSKKSKVWSLLEKRQKTCLGKDKFWIGFGKGHAERLAS